MMRTAALTALPALAAAHGSMTLPATRASEGEPIVPQTGRGGPAGMGGIGCISGACEWFNVGCNGGCDVCTTGEGPYGGGNGYVTPYSMACSVDGAAVGPGMDVHIPGADTLPAEARTWNIGNKSKMGDWTKFMPWRAPGSVASRDPCGVGAGHTIASSGRRAPGAPTGNGSSLPALTNNHTIWKAGPGATAQVAFGLYVNHGGGYQYRVCPKGKAQTEECFRAHPLPFADKTTTVRYHDHSRPDFEIPALDVSTGVIPAGSTWRRNPIPSCNCDQGMDDGPGGCGVPDNPKCAGKYTHPGDPGSGGIGGYCMYHKNAYEHEPGAPTRTPGCSTGTQFPPPWKEGYGHDQAHVASGGVKRPDGMFVYSLVDNIVVPKTPGDYILSWRWDCEQTPQVWNTCADVTVV